MIERQDDNNPWAEKLSEIKLPEAGDSWKAMEVLLDKTLPMEGRGARRRLLLLLLLLLLLIGVCNCPGTRMLNLTKSGNPERPASPARPSSPERLVSQEPGKKRIGNKTIANKVTANKVTGQEGTGGEMAGKQTGVNGKTGKKAPGGGKGTVENEENGKETKDKAVNDSAINDAAVNETVVNDAAINETAVKKKVNKERETTGKSPPGKNHLEKKSPEKKIPEKDPQKIANKGKEKPAGMDTPNPDKGWAVGIGLNHFFTLGQQQQSDYNSGGTSGGLRDYIPVPMVRYYFSKKLFIQLEAQFNTPQYTRKDLLASQPPADTISAQQKLQNSVYIKKLFYFNLPLSIHFSPVKNLYLGTGLQFSRLTNGVGLIEDKLLTVGASDSIKQIQVKSIKGDSVYKKIRTREFRFLVDISFQYKNLVAGARYNQALTNFIQVRISDAQVTQARNSSLQLYLRYILWDQRNHRGNRNQGNSP